MVLTLSLAHDSEAQLAEVLPAEQSADLRLLLAQASATAWQSVDAQRCQSWPASL
jgi:hypothetical protein